MWTDGVAQLCGAACLDLSFDGVAAVAPPAGDYRCQAGCQRTHKLNQHKEPQQMASFFLISCCI